MNGRRGIILCVWIFEKIIVLEYRVNFKKRIRRLFRTLRSIENWEDVVGREGALNSRDRKLFVSDAMFEEICSSIEKNIWNIRFNLLLFILRKLDWKLEELVVSQIRYVIGGRIKFWRDLTPWREVGAVWKLEEEVVGRVRVWNGRIKQTRLYNISRIHLA